MTDQQPAGRGVSPATTVREILDEARRVAGSGSRLAARLEELGIGPPDTNRYSDSAISNWIRGRTMPPADVLVAATLIAGQPLARPQAVPPTDKRLVQLEGVAELLQGQVDAMRAALIDLYGRMGYPLPDLGARVRGEETRPQRSASAG